MTKTVRNIMYSNSDSECEDNGYEDNSDIDEEIEAMMYGEKDLRKGEALKPIPSTNTYMNSLIALIGRQFCGKTYSATRECIKVIRAHQETHLVIYITKTGEASDATFETLKPLLLAPVVYLSYAEAEKFFNEFLDYKRVYNQVKANHLEKDMPEKLKEELYDHLYITDLSKPYLHTLVILEDATKSSVLTDDKNFFNELFTQCRHIQCTFFILAHFWKSLSSNIKSNLSTVYVFGGFSRQQFNYILYQQNLAEETKNVYNIYKKLSGRQKMIIDCNTGSFKTE